ncbi:hypothetical protein BD770DRAFT_382208 [Pilaira anomala]|nr:hypothetical protein BD770DRAFT_382208 [Pilaira anomala]
MQQQQQQQPPTIYHKLAVPCLNFNIEMGPGITAQLSVFEDDDPVQVVDKFERDHAITMSPLHKQRFAEKVAMLLAEYKK